MAHSRGTMRRFNCWPVRRVVPLLAVALAAVLTNPSAYAQQQPPPAAGDRCVAASDGSQAEFFDVTGDGRGFQLDNSDGIPFLDEWLKWKNDHKLDLGCPISQRFQVDTPGDPLACCVFQAFRNVVLQSDKAGPDRGKVGSMLIVDQIAARPNGEGLLKARNVPAPSAWSKNFPGGDGGFQLGWAKEQAFGADAARYPALVNFYSSDGAYFNLAGMPLSSPVTGDDGTIRMRAQKAVLVVRPGGTEGNTQPVTLMDLSGAMLESGLLPKEATIPVPRKGAPTLKITDVTLPERLKLQPETWIVEVEIGNADVQSLLNQGFKASVLLDWQGTGASTLLTNYNVVGSKLQFPTSGVPDVVAAKIKNAGAKGISVPLAVTAKLEGPLFGQADWRATTGEISYPKPVRESTFIENFNDYRPISLALAAIAALIALAIVWFFSKFVGLPLIGTVLRSLTYFVGRLFGRVKDDYDEGKKQRQFRGVLEVGGRRISLQQYRLDNTMHLKPGKLTQVITVGSGSSRTQVKIGVDGKGKMYIGSAGFGEVKVNGHSKHGLTELVNGCSIQVGLVKMRYRDSAGTVRPNGRTATPAGGVNGTAPRKGTASSRTNRRTPSNGSSSIRKRSSAGNRWTAGFQA